MCSIKVFSIHAIFSISNLGTKCKNILMFEFNFLDIYLLVLILKLGQ